MKHEQELARKKIEEAKRKQKAVLDLILENKNQKILLGSIKNKSSKEYKQLQEQVSFIKEQKRLINEDIASAKAEYKKKTELLQERIRIMYENSSFSYIQTIFESKGILDFIDRMHLVKTVVNHDQLLINEVQTAKIDLDEKLKAKQDQENAASQDVKEKMKYIAMLDKSEQAMAKKILNNQNDLKSYERQEDVAIADSKKIDGLIKAAEERARIAAEEAKKRNNNNNNGGGTTVRGTGRYIWPIPGGDQTVTGGSRYGMRIHPVYHSWKMHTGVDIHAPMGVTIVAVDSGSVIYASRMGGYGNVVIIDHGNGITTLYAHCSRLLVSVGENVNQGEAIAKAGSTGVSTGSHLHFEVRVHGNTTDPLNGWI
ncbi:MAG: peptidoglycan DD-metalloendopeptidase family protein [Bacillota bacterium]